MNRATTASRLSTLALAGAFAASASAATVDMTAVFRPDPANPMQNSFENKTPQGGYCGDHPEYCDNGVFSIALPIRFRSVAPIQALHDERQGPMFRVPSYWKDITVLHEETGEAETVRMRVNGIGAAYTNNAPLPEAVWQRAWVYAPAPCQYGGVGYGNALYYAFFWRVPADAGVCAKQAQKTIAETLSFAYENTGFSYELITPNPLKMTAGIYRGISSYTVGPYRDFDMGDLMLPDDDLITLNFTLLVEHTLKVEIPPGGNRVELVPQGGWQAWLTQGRKPVRLFRDQTFNLSASSRFKMNLECQYVSGNTCALREPASGHTVALDVGVTLPNGLTDGTGQPVNRRPLLLNGSGTDLFQPGFYLDRKPGTLHFEVGSEDVQEMLNPRTARNYWGQVTVIWDSEVG
ncbi:hypothetical protein LOY55_24615 [Pseudomonas sp. B21-040]|uniref:hypothetical protein n=1 Tax=Pseudomonas sp. B21-040 TaxID=2895486 RepID=UPI00215F382F|nr:hypothetical protein [Pseudomonas sp. B21-040]UVL39385.1 hypothetical protein LOY55_24615 [Pseudomonas sp. B21-040]